MGFNVMILSSILFAICVLQATAPAAVDTGEVSFVIERIEACLGDYAALSGTLAESAGETDPGDLASTGSFTVEGGELAGLGTLNWETQNIGFVNWVKYLRGYVLARDLEAVELRREIAELRGVGPDSIAALDGEAARLRARIEEEYSGEGNWAD